MADPVESHGSRYPGIDAPAVGSALLTDIDDNSNNVTRMIRGFHINAAGDLKIKFPDGSDATLAVNAGTTYPYQAIRVYVTGTTATGYALY